MQTRRRRACWPATNVPTVQVSAARADDCWAVSHCCALPGQEGGTSAQISAGGGGAGSLAASRAVSIRSRSKRPLRGSTIACGLKAARMTPVRRCAGPRREWPDLVRNRSADHRGRRHRGGVRGVSARARAAAPRRSRRTGVNACPRLALSRREASRDVCSHCTSTVTLEPTGMMKRRPVPELQRPTAAAVRTRTVRGILNS